MSLIAEVIKYGKDIVLLGERVDALLAGRKETTARLEDHERRLIRIETLIEISQARRRELPRRKWRPHGYTNLTPVNTAAANSFIFALMKWRVDW